MDHRLAGYSIRVNLFLLHHKNSHARMAKVDAQLMLTGSCRFKTGTFPSVSIHSSRNIAVLVYASNFGGSLYYSVGEVKKENIVTEWHSSELIDTARGGTTPSVTLIEFQNELYVVETHCSYVFAGRSIEIRYMVGKVIVNDFKIEWSPDEHLCMGYKPKVCANDNGSVVITCEQSGSYKLLYNNGKINLDRNVDWQERDREIPNVRGVTPDVAIHDNIVVFIYRNYHHLKYKIAKLVPNEAISWFSEKSLEERGKRPSISINRDGFVTIYYQSLLKERIYYFVGKLEKETNANETIIKCNDPLLHCTGNYPNVALADDGHVVVVYKSWFSLFTLQGKLHLSGHE